MDKKSNSISTNELKNNVSAKGQIKENAPIRFSPDTGALKLLFIGNSILWHGYLPSIGWYGNWGMAASAEDKDFLHRTIAILKEHSIDADYCIAQLAEWERRSPNGSSLLEELYAGAREWEPDIVIIRIGENCPRGVDYRKDYWTEMIEFFRAPKNAKVIITDSFWKNEARDSMIREIVKENPYIFCQISDIEDDPRSMALDEYEHQGIRVHPSDYGMELIAQRIASAVEKAVAIKE